MAKKQLTLSIPTPCTEDWNNMTPDKNGKFCAACQKTVVDFSRVKRFFLQLTPQMIPLSISAYFFLILTLLASTTVKLSVNSSP